MSDGVLLRLGSIVDWVVCGWFVAFELFGGSGGSGCASSGTGTATLVFVVVKLAEPALFYVEGACLSSGTLRLLGCCEQFGDRSISSFVFEPRIEELRCLGYSGIEVLLNRGYSGCRSGGGCSEIVAWVAVKELEVNVR